MSALGLKTSLVDAISIARLIAALLFASIAFQGFSPFLIATIYALAAASDFLDGFIARKLSVTTFAGKIIDLISDKSLTVVSLLYAAVRGIDILPLAVIGVREIVMLGARTIVIDDHQLLPTSRLFGGVMATILWGTTLFLILTDSSNGHLMAAINILFWICAAVFFSNLIGRLIVSRTLIKRALELDR